MKVWAIITSHSKVDHIENFARREQTFRGKFTPFWMN